MKIIDMRVRAPFAAYQGCNLFGQEGAARLDVAVSPSAVNFSMPLLLEEAQEAGIEKLVVPVRKALAGQNADLAALVEAYPQTVIGLAGIDVVNIEAAILEIEAYVVNGVCQGIIMEPGQDKVPWMVNSSRVYPIYAYCEQHNIPIFMTYGGIMTPSLRYYNPENLDDVAGTFPKLKIGLAHGGWPYVTEVCQIAVNRGNVYLAPDFYMIEAPGMADYIMAANGLLKERMMFASAYPLMPLQAAAEYYMHSGVKAENLPYLMYENAARFLGLSSQN